jgi:DNA-directed RNA polymerase specialized sigma24 family protein
VRLRRHLDYPPDIPPDQLGLAALDDLLERGDLEDWAPAARAIMQAPRGELADAVLALCEAHPMYGTSMLWRNWIERLRWRAAALDADALTLVELRHRQGLTQHEVAESMGISQSDVSKVERRADLRLSTLRAYAEAVGVELIVAASPAGSRSSQPGTVVELWPLRVGP